MRMEQEQWHARQEKYLENPDMHDDDFISRMEDAVAKLEEAKAAFDSLKDHPSKHAMGGDTADISDKLDEMLGSESPFGREAGVKPWLQQMKAKYAERQLSGEPDPHVESLRRLVKARARKREAAQRALETGPRGGKFYTSERGAKIYGVSGVGRGHPTTRVTVPDDE